MNSQELYPLGGVYVNGVAPKFAIIVGPAQYIENIGKNIPDSPVYITPCDTLFLNAVSVPASMSSAKPIVSHDVDIDP